MLERDGMSIRIGEGKRENGHVSANGPSLRNFLARGCARVWMVPLGYKFFDKFKLFGIAVLQSVPNVIRKRYLAVSLKIDNLVETACESMTVKVGSAVYTVRDYNDLCILAPSFESFMLKYFQPRKGEVFLDVGSHMGKYCVATSKIVGDEGLVVAIEPLPANFLALQRNMKRNNLGNMVAFNLAAWAKHCRLKLFVGSNSATSNVNRHNYACGSVEVQAETMDELLINDLNLGRVDWIKIDVEGAEYEVLLGLEETLSRFKPKLIIEVWSKNMGKTKNLLNRHGYSLIQIFFGQAESEAYVYLYAFPTSPDLFNFHTESARACSEIGAKMVSIP